MTASGRDLAFVSASGCFNHVSSMLMKKKNVLSTIQDLEDRVINRFCAVSRRHTCQLPWVDEKTAYEELEDVVRERILFYETRGYYLFQEPFIEHEPVNHRMRVHLTFRPTETNQ